MGTILIDQNDNWGSGRKWMDMQEYLAWRAEDKEKNGKENTCGEGVAS